MEAPHDRVYEALQRLRDQVQWKAGKAHQHLAKRIALGHLPRRTTAAEYEALIQRIVQSPDAEVWVYRWGTTAYPTIVARVGGVQWLVMCSMDGVMETAFPLEDVARYLADPRFTRVGTREELGL